MLLLIEPTFAAPKTGTKGVEPEWFTNRYDLTNRIIILDSLSSIDDFTLKTKYEMNPNELAQLRDAFPSNSTVFDVRVFLFLILFFEFFGFLSKTKFFVCQFKIIF
jgi:hypothetical protein